MKRKGKIVHFREPESYHVNVLDMSRRAGFAYEGPEWVETTNSSKEGAATTACIKSRIPLWVYSKARENASIGQYVLSHEEFDARYVKGKSPTYPNGNHENGANGTHAYPKKLHEQMQLFENPRVSSRERRARSRVPFDAADFAYKK